MEDEHERAFELMRPPDERTQSLLAGIELTNLREYAQSDDPETKRLAEWELKNRYAPCVYGKNEKIKMNPHYERDRQWQTHRDRNGHFTRRACVTYEDPEASQPEWYDYTDRIRGWYEDEQLETARQAANSGAEPSTAKWLEIYLSSLTGQTIRVNRVITGIRTDGYAWNAIGQSKVQDVMAEEEIKEN